MEQPSDLEKFLNAQGSDGKVQAKEASFTLAREKALAKMAEFQLPFAGAWAVKIIQAAVASGVHTAIRVDLTSKETHFFFPTETPWSLAEIEHAFYQPEPHPERYLRHLVSGLWAAGLNARCSFQVCAPGESSSLIWDGSQTIMAESEKRYDCIAVTVAHGPRDKGGALGWVKAMAGSGARNAETLTALSEHCYTCPVPLTVDGRRVDSLQLCPEFGWGKTTFPVSLGFADGELPEFGVPPGTYKDLRDATTKMRDGGGVTKINEFALKALESRERTNLALMLTAHLKLVSQGRSSSWQSSMGESGLIWVQDGAVVDREHLRLGPSSCSVAIFVSAQDLPTDLTGMKLAGSDARKKRVSQACRLAHRTMLQMGGLEKEGMLSRGKLRGRVLGGVLLLAGLGSIWASPAHGVGLMLGGGVSIATAGTQEQRLSDDLELGMKTTMHELGRPNL